MKLEGKVSLVTGSARGIGWQIAHAYATEGAAVVICDLGKPAVEDAAARLGLSGDRVLGMAADVTKEREVRRLFEAVAKRFGHLDVLVNNAGFAWPRHGPQDLELADTPLEVWLKVIATNLTGAFLCSREALRLMRPRRGGTIINVSSPQGKRGKALRGPYCAAKFGLEGMSQALALENAAYGIRVNALDPGGLVATEAIRQIPANRGLRAFRPEIVRGPAVYLASADSTGVTGQSVVAPQWCRENGVEVPHTIID